MITLILGSVFCLLATIFMILYLVNLNNVVRRAMSLFWLTAFCVPTNIFNGITNINKDHATFGYCLLGLAVLMAFITIINGISYVNLLKDRRANPWKYETL